MSEDIHVTSPDGEEIIFRAENFKRLNDPSCKHEYIEDPEDETDTYRSVKCTKCPLGKLIKKSS